MSPAQLHLFPAPANVSRKNSFRRTRNENQQTVDGVVNFQGVAFQVVPPRTAQVAQAPETIKHSLFCEPPSCTSTIELPVFSSTTNPDSASGGLLRRQSRTRRRSGPITSGSACNGLVDPKPAVEADQLCPLPQNTHFGSGSPPKRSLLSRLSRHNVPQNISIAPKPEQATGPVWPVDENDQLSPLPSRTHFTQFSPTLSTEYPTTKRSASPATMKSSYSQDSGYSSPMRSIFPAYDPSRTLDRQSYYPTPAAQSPPPYMSGSVSKIGSPVERSVLRRFDSGVGLLNGYEHIPGAGHADLEALWKASREEFPVAGRKVQFGLYQPPGNGKSLAIGTSQEDIIFSMERDMSDISPDHAIARKQFAVKKNCPTSPHSSPVAQLVLPERCTSGSTSKETKEMTAIFPQAAAVSYIEAVLNSPQAHHIATFDPHAESPQAARLAEDAVSDAHRDYSCDLIKRARKRDSLGAVTAAYDLVHPLLGTCPVTVTKSQSAASTTGPRAKISLHHPSATPAAIASDTLNLAFLDFAHDACVLDIPALLALDSHHVVDTVISALLAVAVIENDALMQDSITFEAPPRTPLPQSRKEERRVSVGSASSKNLFTRSAAKKKEKKQKKVEPQATEEEEVELPGLARASLKVIEFGFKATAWVVVTGVKVGFKVGTGVGGYAVKKMSEHK